MKKMTEAERILSVFGGFLIIASLAMSLLTEVNARNQVNEYRRRVSEGAGIIQQGIPATYGRNIGYDQQTLASRWSFPDGHGTLGAGFAMFGVLLIAAPRAAAKKRMSNA